MNIKTLLLILGFWVGIGVLYLSSLLLDASRYKTGFQLNTSMVGTFVVVYMAWGLLTIGIYSLINKSINQAQQKYIAITFILGLVIWQPAIAWIDHGSFKLFSGNGLMPLSEVFEKTSFAYLFFNFVLYVVVFILCAGVIYFQKSQQMKVKTSELAEKHALSKLHATKMKFQTLQSQLSPHFLFNCLNSISALTRVAKKEHVIQSIARLGDLLRYSLNASSQYFIVLAEEIEFTEKYIALQKLRMGNRFNLKFDIEDGIEHLSCPPFIIQTLVENVFNHGISDDSSIIDISITLSTHGEQLCIKVTNSLSKGNKLNKKGLGLGLENLKKRLQFLYNDDMSINIENNDSSFTSTIMIPLKNEEHD